MRRWNHGTPAAVGTLLLCTALACGEALGEQAFGEQALGNQDPDPTSPVTIARGKALAEAADCAGCHTADATKPFAGGKLVDTPFGAITSPNLTPDPATGIGTWSQDDFYRALHAGIAPNGSRYYPAFPYPYFTRLNRADVLAIRAWLATLPPVSNATPLPQLRWPLNYRLVMRGWNLLFFRAGTFKPDSRKSEAWNRGAYLVEGAAHCGACHTPKNAWGADRRDHPYGGGPVGGWFAPRLDSAPRSGLKSWSVDDIAEYLQSGRNAKSHAGGPMAEVVTNSTSKMSDDDVKAIAIYLKDLPAGTSEPTAVAPSPSQMNEGAMIYKGACISCHETDGSGSPRVYPPLPGNANLQSADPSNTLDVILDGAETLITARAPNPGSMPAYKDKLTDQQIAAVTSYIRNAWGNAATPVDANQVAKARALR